MIYQMTISMASEIEKMNHLLMKHYTQLSVSNKTES